jgi:hypothetical protein
MIKQEFVIERDAIPLPKDGQITLFSCRHDESAKPMIVRKFRADCGNTFEVHVTCKSGYIRSIKPLYDCPPDCKSCADRIEKIRRLIASEHNSC